MYFWKVMEKMVQETTKFHISNHAVIHAINEFITFEAAQFLMDFLKLG